MGRLPITKTCKNSHCKEIFEISVNEQKFFDSKQDDLGNPLQYPNYCKNCRAKRRAEREAQQV